MTQLAFAITSPYSTSFSQAVNFASSSSSLTDNSFYEKNIRQIYENTHKKAFEDCISIVANFSLYKGTEGSNNALTPKLSTIKKTKELLYKISSIIYETNNEWLTPLITIDENGYIVLEWWGRQDKKITFYIGSDSNLLEYLKSSNENIDEMEDGELKIFTIDNYMNFFDWLRDE